MLLARQDPVTSVATVRCYQSSSCLRRVAHVAGDISLDYGFVGVIHWETTGQLQYSSLRVLAHLTL